jgi:hypothetical protein
MHSFASIVRAFSQPSIDHPSIYPPPSAEVGAPAPAPEVVGLGLANCVELLPGYYNLHWEVGGWKGAHTGRCAWVGCVGGIAGQDLAAMNPRWVGAALAS